MNSPPARHPATTAVNVSEQQSDRLVISITSLGHLLCHMGELVFIGVMLAVKKEMDLDETAITTLPMLGFILMGVGALPVGVWADWWGPARVFQIYFVSLAVSAVLVALATDVWQLFAALTLLGLALSIYHPVGLSLLSFGVKARGKALGINGVAGSIGIAMGPFLGASAAALGHWRLAFVVLAALSLVAAGLMALAWRRLGSFACASGLCDQRPPYKPEAQAKVAAVWRRSLPVVLLSISMLFGGFNYRCLVTALPHYCGGEGGSDNLLSAGGEILFILLVGGCIGQYFGGWAIDRLGPRIYPVFIAVLIPCGLALAVSQGSTLSVGIAALLAVNLFAQQPAENSLLAEWTPRGRRGLSYGTKIALTFGFGALGSLVTGVIWKSAGTPAPVFFLFAGTGMVMVLLVIMALVQRRKVVLVESGAA
jgi:MFS family permease